MEFEEKRFPINKIDGIIENGKQFDIDIVLPEDTRNVIYGIVKDCSQKPIQDAVVKLIEIDEECGKKVRKAVSHTFTDKEGEFVFGPLCPDKKYDLQIWVNKVNHVQICSKCHKEGKCLKAIEAKPCEFYVGKRADLEKCIELAEKNNDENCENTL